MRYSPDEKFEYKDGNLLDSQGRCVMMPWEEPLMKRSAEIVCENGGRILNIGHGLGIVDSYIQQQNITEHNIIEAHPEVHKFMDANNWFNKPNVIIHTQRWENIIFDIGKFDGIYFDTWVQTTAEMNILFHSLIEILNPGGVFAMYNSPRQTVRTLPKRLVKEGKFSLSHEEVQVEVTEQQQVNGDWVYWPIEQCTAIIPVIRKSLD